ncbi:hypothetical protein CPC08DRAFT_821399 [Agrocybe pediades]|nr:hypothetical protein CPC08DRAFT_821399 [Agrocybe pediades]
MPMLQTPTYSPVEQIDEDEGAIEKLLGQNSHPLAHPRGSRVRNFWARYWAHITHGSLGALSLLFFCLWLHARTKVTVYNPMMRVYSPANVAVEYNKELTKFNGTFDWPSEYRGQPSEEIDAEWWRISQAVKPTRLSRDDIVALGKNPDSPSLVRFPEEDGGGYMASIEVTHQLHCLNFLRKYTFHSHYETFDPVFTAPKPDTFRKHLDHCVEIIRQNLMCSADVGMLTYEWVKGFSVPYPDFNTQHQCRNFEKILKWGMDNAVHIPRNHVHRLPDTIDLPTPP